MSEPESRTRSASRSGRSRRREISGVRHTSVLGAGSFGTALAVLLDRAGLRVTLHTRSPEQAALLLHERENKRYLPGVELPPELSVEPSLASLERADLIFLAVPSSALAEVIASLGGGAVRRRPARRQDLPKAWVLNGAIYLFRTAVLFDPVEPNLYGDKVAAYSMPPPYGFNIDEPEDWATAERLLTGSAAR